MLHSFSHAFYLGITHVCNHGVQCVHEDGPGLTTFEAEGLQDGHQKTMCSDGIDSLQELVAGPGKETPESYVLVRSAGTTAAHSLPNSLLPTVESQNPCA